MRDLSSEKHFDNYIKNVPDDILVQFYHDIEWTSFPVLVIDEYQRRFKSKAKRDILERLKKKVEITGVKGIEFGKHTLHKGYDASKKLKNNTKGISKNIEIAKAIGPSPMENLRIIEKLGKLKESGLITEKEFQQKKKQLLKKI